MWLRGRRSMLKMEGRKLYKYLSAKYLICEFLIAFLLAFGISGGKLLVYPVYMQVTVKNALSFLLIWILCFPVALGIYILCDFLKGNINKKGTHEITKNQLKLRWCIYFLITFGISFMYHVAFNPAIMFGDSYLQVGMANGTIPIDAWQPLFDTLCIKLILTCCNSLQAIVIVQILYWSIVISSIFFYLAKRTGRWVALGVLLVFFSFSPSQGLQVATILKDVPFATTLIWMTLIIMRLLDNKTQKTHIFVEAGICIPLISLIRLNGIVIALAFLGVLFLLTRMDRRIVISFGITLLIFGGYQLSSRRVEYIPVPEGAEYLALINDMQVTKTVGFEVSDEVEEYLANIQDQADYEKFYEINPAVGNSVYNYEYAAEYTLSRFVKIYLGTFIRHPIVMIRNILVRTLVLWDFTENMAPSTCAGITYYAENHYQWENFPDYGERNENGLTILLQKLTDLSLKQPAAAFFWRVPFFTILLVIEISILLLNGERKRLFLFVPVISCIFTLLLTVFCQDYRYFWPVGLSSIVLLFPVLQTDRNGEMKKHTLK